MLNFCTLFDSNYLARGLVLYDSLQKVCPEFTLYVFAFDEQSRAYLAANKRPNLTVISLNEFEDASLLAIKESRTKAEYCWTCTPSTIAYCIKTFQLDHCTYIDADMVFYSNPQILIDEMGNKSVLISPHRYSRAYDQSDYSGIYCVQFVTFRNNEDGWVALSWWRARCIEWCYAKLEDGKFGDQKYLDDWPTRFRSVHVLQNNGAGIAPWNARDHTNAIEIAELVFFHFHGLRFYADGHLSLCGPLYELNNQVRKEIYFPYVSALLEKEKQIKSQDGPANANGASGKAPTQRTLFIKFWIETIKQIKKGKLSPFQVKNFNFKLHNHLYLKESFLH